MNDIDIMEQNLARLLSEHLTHSSLDPTEPHDPFQKRTFGRKLRKSALSAHSPPREHPSLPRALPALHPDGRPQEERGDHQLRADQQGGDEETEMYMREVEVLMARLRVGVERVEEHCRERVQRLCTTTTGKQRQQKAEALLGEIEASVDFVTHDCFSF